MLNYPLQFYYQLVVLPHGKSRTKKGMKRSRENGSRVELYTNSVFLVGIRSVFLRYYQYHTEGKLGRYQKGGNGPLFPQKGGNGPLFEELQPPFGKKGGGKGGEYTKKGGTIPTAIPKIQQI